MDVSSCDVNRLMFCRSDILILMDYQLKNFNDIQIVDDVPAIRAQVFLEPSTIDSRIFSK